MMYAINNITIVGGREKRRESLRLIAPRKSGPIGCLSEGPGSGKDQKRVACHEVVGWNSLGGQMPNAVAERISFYRHADFSLSLFDRRAGIT